MAKLEITFSNMFLLVRSLPPTVLVPNGESAGFPHTVTVSGVKGGSLHPTDSDFDFCTKPINEDHHPARWEGTTTVCNFPGEELLNLCRLSKNPADCRIQKALHSNDGSNGGSRNCPSLLNGRFYLPYGCFDTSWSDKDFANLTQLWEIPHANDPKNVQQLRETIVFECVVPDNLQLSLRETTAAGVTYHDIHSKPGKDIRLFVTGTDLKPYKSNHAMDFAVVYELAANPKGWPVPKRYGTLGSSVPFPVKTLSIGPARPICGAGQGCPEP